MHIIHKKRLWRAYISFIDWSDPGDWSEEIRQSFAKVCQEEKQLQQGNLSPQSCNKMLRILRKITGRNKVDSSPVTPPLPTFYII